ncbi:ATP-binding protein [Bacillus safensis]|uniref:ATP-binding protein n=1 Tax=Bacillus safensis TaxID=561879 RepID=UPI002DBACF93|nr:ATP-binding protein [Bacillus safensis]MEC3737016.1 ATP-binding protein [Bacillus safensis]
MQEEKVYPVRYETLTVISEQHCMYGKCDGSGLIWIIDHEQNKEFMEECPCKEVKKLSNRLMSARLPEEFKDASLNSFDINVYDKPESKERAANAKRVAKNYVLKFDKMRELGKGLYFFSEEKGSGKTRLAASILHAITKVYDKKEEKPLKIIYSSTADLIGEIKSTFDSESKVKSTDIMDAVKTADLVVLDDIGVENVTKFVEETFTRILDYRLQYKKPTIITSNLSIDDLDTIYKSGRISSRVEKMAFPVIMPDEKIRKKKAQEENEKLLLELYE